MMVPAPMFAVATAFAQGAAPAAGAGGPTSFLVQFMPFILIFVIIYFLIMRPQQKKQKQLQEMLRSLEKGDRVVLQAGIYGTIAALDEKTVTLQVDERVRLKVQRWAVAEKVTGDAA